jgi:choline dehydrogenase-like flavoprotein
MRGAERAGVPVLPARLSILTRRINRERGVCFFCAQCNRACSAYADFSAGTVLVYPAKRAGKLDLYTHAMVRAVNTDASGRATGVSYVSKTDRREYEIRGRVVLLGASACESARILLNSASSRHPQGIGNQGGHVGRYLHDSTGADRAAILPSLIGRERYNEDGVGGAHIYSPWWLDAKGLDFPRGYHIEFWGGMGMPGYGIGMSMDTMRQYVLDEFGKPSPNGGYGAGLKNDMRALFGATIGMSGRGESVPQFSNYCEIDPDTVDQWGIPVLRFHYKWTDHERRQARHMQDTFEEILTATGATLLGTKPGADRDYGLLNPGAIIHEVGTTRMGDDPDTSVTDRFGRTHDCDNVYVVDAGTFVSQADKNPTWTILALSWRTADHIVDRFKKGELT